MCYPLINGIIVIILVLETFVDFNQTPLYVVFNFLEDLQGTLIVIVFLFSNYPILCINESPYHCYKSHWCWRNNNKKKSNINYHHRENLEDNGLDETENYILNCQSVCGQIMCPCEECPALMNCCIYTLLCKYSFSCKNVISRCFLSCCSCFLFRKYRQEDTNDLTNNNSSIMDNNMRLSRTKNNMYYADVDFSLPETQLSMELLPSFTSSSSSRESLATSL